MVKDPTYPRTRRLRHPEWVGGDIRSLGRLARLWGRFGRHAERRAGHVWCRLLLREAC